MTPIDGKPSRKGDQWGKKVRLPKQRRGCLSVLVPLRPPTIPARGFPRTRARVAGRPTLTSPVGRPARGAL